MMLDIAAGDSPDGTSFAHHVHGNTQLIQRRDQRSMKKLDRAQFSYVEIDPQALENVRGGILPDPPLGGGAADPSKPVGKGRKILCGLGLLGCTILGPEAPDPGETGLGGVGGPPKGRPPAGAPPTPGPNKLTPLIGLNAG